MVEASMVEDRNEGSDCRALGESVGTMGIRRPLHPSARGREGTRKRKARRRVDDS